VVLGEVVEVEVRLPLEETLHHQPLVMVGLEHLIQF
jgi:hypothetical protein